MARSIFSVSTTPQRIAYPSTRQRRNLWDRYQHNFVGSRWYTLAACYAWKHATTFRLCCPTSPRAPASPSACAPYLRPTACHLPTLPTTTCLGRTLCLQTTPHKRKRTYIVLRVRAGDSGYALGRGGDTANCVTLRAL